MTDALGCRRRPLRDSAMVAMLMTAFSAFTDCMQEPQRKHPYQEWLTANKKQTSPTPSAPSTPAGGNAPRGSTM